MRPFMCLSAFSLLVGNLGKKKKKKNCVKSSLDDRSSLQITLLMCNMIYIYIIIFVYQQYRIIYNTNHFIQFMLKIYNWLLY